MEALKPHSWGQEGPSLALKQRLCAVLLVVWADGGVLRVGDPDRYGPVIPPRRRTNACEPDPRPDRLIKHCGAPQCFIGRWREVAADPAVAPRSRIDSILACCPTSSHSVDGSGARRCAGVIATRTDRVTAGCPLDETLASNRQTHHSRGRRCWRTHSPFRCVNRMVSPGKPGGVGHLHGALGNTGSILIVEQGSRKGRRPN